MSEEDCAHDIKEFQTYTGSFVAGGIVYFLFEDAVCFVAVCLECSVEIVSDGHCPSLLCYFCKWDNLVPIHISQPLVLWWHWGLLALGSVVLS